MRLLLLALLLPVSCHGAPSGDDLYDPSLCLWQPSTCGNVNIDYPFYLSSKTGVLQGSSNSSYYCGYPGLAIRCEDGNQAFLRLGNGTYRVSNIDYTGNTFSLVDPEVFEDERCPRVDHNVTLPQFSWLYYPDTAVAYVLFLLNCNFTMDWSPPKTVSPITCAKGPGRSFVLLQAEGVPDEDWRKACQRITVPVLKDVLWSDPQNHTAWSSGGYSNVLRAGFQLAWEGERKTLSCNQCEQSSGRCGYNQAGEHVGCFCSDGRIGAQKICSSGEGRRKRTKIYIVAATSCILLLCLIILMFYLTRKYGSLISKIKDAPNIESFLQKNGNIHSKRYTYTEVKRMTKSFAVKLGQGGFGVVYKGNLPNGHDIAVKMLKDNKGNGEEFMNEVASISRTSHINVVTLLGFCLQGSKRALIYEYMPKGSLERYAFNRNLDSESTLTWEKLFEIAIGIARGLEYLHRGCNTRIVHFDIKPHNILLDQDFCPKISDFGLAKLCLNKESAISIVGARGTIGYIAPEVYSKQFGTISSKSDVYSYGMMVLEMVGARDKNNNSNSESSSQYFPQWVYKHLDDYCISAPEINDETTELVRKMIVVGLWCIQVIPTHRPTMTRVVEMLEGSTSTLELPPKMLFG